MLEGEWNRCAGALEAYWPRARWGDATLLLWRRGLEARHMEFTFVAKGIQRLAEESPHAPSLADVIKAARELRKKDRESNNRALEGSAGEEGLLPEGCECVIKFANSEDVAVMTDEWFGDHRPDPTTLTGGKWPEGLEPVEIIGNAKAAPGWIRTAVARRP